MTAGDVHAPGTPAPSHDHGVIIQSSDKSHLLFEELNDTRSTDRSTTRSSGTHRCVARDAQLGGAVSQQVWRNTTVRKSATPSRDSIDPCAPPRRRTIVAQCAIPPAPVPQARRRRRRRPGYDDTRTGIGSVKRRNRARCHATVSAPVTSCCDFGDSVRIKRGERRRVRPGDFGGAYRRHHLPVPVTRILYAREPHSARTPPHRVTAHLQLFEGRL